MLDKLFSDEKIFRIFSFCSIVILFFIVLRKNKKEKFTRTAPDNADEFKTKVETALGENIQAINNLGEFASKFIKTDGLIDLSAVDLKVKSLEVVKNLTVRENLTVGGNFNIAKLLGLPLIGSQCFKKNGTGEMDFYGNACGTNLNQDLPANNRGVTEGYTKNLKLHGSSCSSSGSKCQNLYRLVSSA